MPESTHTGGSNGILQNYAGTIHNLNAIQAQGDSAFITFDFDSNIGTEAVNAVYLNGKPVKSLAYTLRQTGLANLGFNINRIEIVPYIAGQAYLELEGDYNGGTHAFLRWTPSTSTDLKSYDIYWNRGSDIAPTTLLDKQTRIAIYEGIKEGSLGAGRIQFFGNYTGIDTVNDTLALTITGAGAASWAFAGDSGTVTWSQKGDTVTLRNGLYATFLDESGTYTATGVYNVFIGLLNEFQTDPLAEGNYVFTIKATDKSFNTTTITDTVTVPIVFPPSPVSDAAISYDSDSNHIILTWVNPLDLDFDHVEVYTNWNKVTNTLESYVIEESPIYSGGSQAYSLTVQINPATYLFYIRAFDTSGRNDESINLLSITLPFVPTLLDAPANVAIANIAQGQYALTWKYRYKENDPITEFHIYWGADIDETDLGSGSPNVTVSADAVAGLVDSFTYDFAAADVPATDGQVIYVLVRSSDGTNDTQNRDDVSITVDLTGPSFAGPLQGQPN